MSVEGVVAYLNPGASHVLLRVAQWRR